MFNPRYALFYDNHTQAEVYDVGANFNAAEFVAQVRRCGADYLTFHAQCNRGFAYYDTEIGIRHPGLKYDLFGALAAECAANGVALAAYFNGGISGAVALAHRDWTVIRPDGSCMLPEKANPFSILMCLNSPYRRHLFAMIGEVARRYPNVAGYFVDCIAARPCICPYCEAEREKRGIATPEEMAEITEREFCAELRETVRRANPDAVLFINTCNVFDVSGESESFFDCECLPTADWGYECLPTLAHWVRTIRPGTPVLNMTGRFYDWGDFGGLRSATSLKYDLLYGLMHGMRPEIGGHFHPRGDLDLPVFDRIAEVYAELKRYDAFFDGAVVRSEIAVAMDSEAEMRKLVKPLRAAVRMLEELKIPFDVVTGSDHDISGYKVLILPENTEFSARFAAQLEHFPGAVVAAGAAAARRFGARFGVESVKEVDFAPVFYHAPGMPRSLYSGAAAAVPAPGAVAVGELVKPYCVRGYRNGMAVWYTPPEKGIGAPLTIRRDNSIWCAGELFSGYCERAAEHLRELFAELLEQVHPEPVLRTSGLYSFTRTALTFQGERRIVHLLNCVAERRGEAAVVEDEIELAHAEISLRLDGFKPVHAVYGPERRELDFVVADGRVTVKLPPFKMYAALALEGERDNETF